MSSTSNARRSWDYSDAEVVDGVANVVDSGGTSNKPAKQDDSKGEGICHWTGTFRNPAFWILVGVIGTIGFQYVFKKASKQ